MQQKIPDHWDVVILGAGAAGLMCAIEAGKRGRRVAVIDHAKAPGEKIRISGGGRCNFTNLHCGPKNFLSQNPAFAISALKRYTQHDFIALVNRHRIPFHEKTLGQLFCDGSSREIVSMLMAELKAAGGKLYLQTSFSGIRHSDGRFQVSTSQGEVACESLVIATGGKSIPKMGATGIGYDIAEQFGHPLIEPRPALVPFTFSPEQQAQWGGLVGVSFPVRASCNGGTFDEAMLITHRGASGPAMLQVSSYWREGDEIDIDMAPGEAVQERLAAARNGRPRAAPVTLLAELLPKSLAEHLLRHCQGVPERTADLSNKTIETIAALVHRHRLKPNGTEGYRTAEVTLGGVDTRHLSQKTMESKQLKGLFFIGEVVDVTGHLGGHNFQWAWSSGWAAGQGV